MDRRQTRRMAGMLRKRLPEAALEEVDDPRSRRGRRRDLGARLRAVVVGMLAGCKSLLDLFRAVTQRSEERRKTPWRDLVRATYLALLRGDLPGPDAHSLDAAGAFATP